MEETVPKPLQERGTNLAAHECNKKSNQFYQLLLISCHSTISRYRDIVV